jgi:hypothetical protein
MSRSEPLQAALHRFTKTRGVEMAPVVTWQDVHKIAESLHGMRKAKLGVRYDGKKFIVEEFDEANPDGYILQTDPVPARAKKGPLKVCVPGMDRAALESRLGRALPADMDVFDAADAVLWSMPAVEKFLVPYYSSFMDLQDVMTTIRDRFDHPDVLAYIHMPNSEVVDDGSSKLQPYSLFAVTPSKEKGSEKLALVPIM